MNKNNPRALRWRPRLPRGSFFVESQKNPIESMWFLSVYLPTWMNGWCLWEMYCKLIYSPRLPNTLGFEAFGPPKTYKENTKPQQVFGRLGFYIDPTGYPFIIFYPVAYFHAFSKIWSLGSLPSSMLLGGNHHKLFGRGPTTQSLANLLIMVINHHEPLFNPWKNRQFWPPKNQVISMLRFWGPMLSGMILQVELQGQRSTVPSRRPDSSVKHVDMHALARFGMISIRPDPGCKHHRQVRFL